MVGESGRTADTRTEHNTVYLRIVKPVADRVFAALLLLVLAPLVVLVAAFVRVTLGPDVIYRQRRVGKGNRPFTMYKFRTLAPDRRRTSRPHRGHDRRMNHKSDEDPRHTQQGRTLRKWSLDEIPQLWNVVVGDMSFVGPRPELVEVVAKYHLENHPRTLVKPGITGLWQVSRHRCEPLHDHLRFDEVYVSEVGLWADIKILLATPRAVLQRRGR